MFGSMAGSWAYVLAGHEEEAVQATAKGTRAGSAQFRVRARSAQGLASLPLHSGDGEAAQRYSVRHGLGCRDLSHGEGQGDRTRLQAERLFPQRLLRLEFDQVDRGWRLNFKPRPVKSPNYRRQNCCAAYTQTGPFGPLCMSTLPRVTGLPLPRGLASLRL
jgi:hypothetical protein